jgi:hypothetical protein
MLEWLEPSRFLLALVTPLLVLATAAVLAASRKNMITSSSPSSLNECARRESKKFFS